MNFTNWSAQNLVDFLPNSNFHAVKLHSLDIMPSTPDPRSRFITKNKVEVTALSLTTNCHYLVPLRRMPFVVTRKWRALWFAISGLLHCTEVFVCFSPIRIWMVLRRIARFFSPVCTIFSNVCKLNKLATRFEQERKACFSYDSANKTKQCKSHGVKKKHFLVDIRINFNAMAKNCLWQTTTVTHRIGERPWRSSSQTTRVVLLTSVRK